MSVKTNPATQMRRKRKRRQKPQRINNGRTLWGWLFEFIRLILAIIALWYALPILDYYLQQFI